MGFHVRPLEACNRCLMREVNSKLVLKVIKSSSPTSQIELAKKTNLSAGTITSIVRELKKLGFISEIGKGKSLAGRRPVLIQFNQQARHIVSLELTIDKTTLAIIDLGADIKLKTEDVTARNIKPAKMLKFICRQIKDLIRNSGITNPGILGIGVAVDGIVYADQKVLVRSVNLGWTDIPIKAIIEELTGFKTVVNGTALCMVFGEYLYGAGKNVDNLVCLDIDSGIGAIAIDQGRILRGSHDMAGEIGHSLAKKDGPLCRCGNKGCLETVASGSAIISRVKDNLNKGIRSSVSDSIFSCNAPDALRLITKAFQKGGRLSKNVLSEAGYYLGVAAAGLINLFDPELLILSGFVTTESEGIITDMIRKTAIKHILPEKSRSIRIEEGTLGTNAAVIGAAAAVYAIMAEKGFFPKDWLKTYYCDDGKLCGHISHHVPGVELSTGSLGHGLPVAAGMALAAKHAGAKHRIFVLMSDGDCNEGSTWEAIMFAVQHKFDNLTAIVDYNKIQALGKTKDVINLEPFAKKIENFGWAVKEIDGHNFEQIDQALKIIPFEKSRPSFVIAHTVKGKGISYLENTVASHYQCVPDEKLADAYKELGVPYEKRI